MIDRLRKVHVNAPKINYMKGSVWICTNTMKSLLAAL